MLLEIQDAILDKLNAGGIVTKIFSAQDDRGKKFMVTEGSPQNRPRYRPLAFCSIDTSKFERNTMTSYKQTVIVTLIVGFKDAENEASRREGIYPILESINQLLLLQNLNLTITPLIPISMNNITIALGAQADEIYYQFEYETSFIVTKTDPDANAVQLLRINLKGYLQLPTDDGVEDTEALVDLEGL